MKQKNIIIFLFFVVSKLFALPEVNEVISGKADFVSSEPKTMAVVTSNKAIINYRKFNIDRNEKVEFIQPSEKSCVLNRVIGKNISQILGGIKSNGKVFLVNPQGIYFGKNATVNTGSFVASTLNIKDEDFLNDSFKFFRDIGSENSKIINDGTLSAADSGFIALFSPIIENHGSILAKAGKIALASAEKITLDFSQDGLVQFILEGDLEEAVIKNYGKIISANGDVLISLKAAKKAIKMVVNTDGITPANAIEEVDGHIFLVHKSVVKGKKVHVEGNEGSKICVEGIIDITNPTTGESGGVVNILGDQIELKGADIDASGDFGGGTVLIGGDFKGKGKVRNAINTIMDKDSKISADAYSKGDGGKVILWADDTTLFDGKIFARGEIKNGRGGFVETSGKEELCCGDLSYVDTSASPGNFGTWLLDPRSIIIAIGGGATIAQCSAPNCSTNQNRTISPVTIAASASNVSLCSTRRADSSITVTDPVTMINPGVTLTLTAGSTSVGPINLNNSLTTRGGSISLVGVVTVGAAATLDTTNAGATAAGANISFSTTVNGANALSLRAGTGGNISFGGAVGDITPLTSLAITSANNAAFSNVSVGSITQSAGVGTTSFGVLNTSAIGGVSLTGNGFTFNNTVTTTAAGPVIINNSGTATISSGANFSVAGAFNQSGSGPVSLSANIIKSASGTISFLGPVTLAGTVALNSAGGNIAFNNTINGNQALSLTAGAGAVQFGVAGGVTPLGAMSVVSASNVTLAALSAASFTQSAGTGITTFNGAVATSGIGGISLTGTNFAINNTLTTTGGGLITITNSEVFTTAVGANIVSSGAFSQNGAGVNSLSANVTTSNAALSFLRAITLGGGITLNSGAGAGNITLSSTVNGAHGLVLSSGTGTVAVSGAIGATTPLSSLTVTGNLLSLTNIGGASAGVSGATSLTSTGSITFSGNTYNSNAQNYTADTNFNMNAGALTTFTSTNDAISFTTGTIRLAASTDLTINSAGGNIILANADAVAGNLRTFTLNAGAGTIQVGSIGAASASEFASLSFTGGDLKLYGNLVSNNLTLTSGGANTIYLGGNITTNGTNISFSRPVIRDTVASSTLSTGAGAGNISFSSTLDGDVDNTRSLILSAGTGNITFNGAVGATHLLNNLTISTANNVTAAALTLSSLTQSAGTGTTIFNGALAISGILGIDLTGSSFTFNNTVATTGGGNMTVANSGLLSLPVAATLTLGSHFAQTGSGTVQLANSIVADEGISFAGAATLAGPTALDTSGNNKNIVFSDTIDGGFDLTLTAGSGNITVSGAIGSSSRLGDFHVVSANDILLQNIYTESVSIDSCSGTLTSNGVMNTNGAAGITLIGNNFLYYGNLTTTGGGSLTVTNSGTGAGVAGMIADIDGSFLQNGSGSIGLYATMITHTGGITFANPVTLYGPSTLNTSAGGGDINISSTIDGTSNLTFIAGAGNIILGGAVGGITPLGAITINSADNVTAQAITAASIEQVAGTGTTDLQGAVTTFGAAGIALTTNAITRGAAITTTGGGPLTITNGGLFTSSAAGDVHLTGAFVQNGVGNVILGGEIFVEDQPISFSSPITLAANTDLDSGNIGADIILSGTVNGAFELEVCPVAGNLVVNGDIGTSVRLTTFNIYRTANASVQKVYAGNIIQTEGTGTTTFNDVLNTNGALGIYLQGVGFSFDNTVTTTGSGPMEVISTGTTTFNAVATGSIDGAFTVKGGGSIVLSSSITAAGAMQFLNAASVSGTASLSTAAANESITFFDTLDGPGDLTLALGTGDLTIQGAAAGGTTELGAVVISSARNVTVEEFSAASLIQSGGTGTSLFQGTLTISAIGGISLTGTAFTFMDNLTTTNSGPIAIFNSGAATFTTGKTVTSNSTFTQTNVGGGSTVSLAGSIITNNAALSFSSPITLTSASILNSGAGSGDIILSSTVNGTVAGLQGLTLSAGTGDISLVGVLGGVTRLGDLVISSVNDLDSLSITALSINQQAGSGTTTLVGNYNTSGTSGVSLTGTNFARTGNITTTNGGSVQYTTTGVITGALGNTAGISGNFVQVGEGAAINRFGTWTTGGNITCEGDTLINNDAVTYSATGNIALNGTVNSKASENHTCTFTSGGDISLNGDVGTTDRLNVFDVTAATNFTAEKISAVSIEIGSGTAITSTTTFNDLLNANGALGIVVNGQVVNVNANVTTTGAGIMTIANSGLLTIANGVSFSIDGAFSQNGAGVVSSGGSITTTNDNIGFATPFTMTANSVFNTGAGAGNITFAGRVGGAYTLNLTAGSGNVNFQDTVGIITPPAGITIASATNVTASSSIIVAGPFTIASATGTSTFSGLLSTTTSSGISVTGSAFTFSEGITTSDLGPIAISNSGLVTFPASKTVSSNSTFTQTNVGGTGTVSLGGTVVTNNEDLSFGSPITLTAATLLNSGSGAGSITVANTIDGTVSASQALNFTAGTGDISVTGAMGGTTRLGIVVVNSGYDVSVKAINALSFAQLAGTGTTTFSGTLNTSGMDGISLNLNKVLRDGDIVTTGGGSVTLTNSGLGTCTGIHVTSIDGSYIQNGTGPIDLGGTISTNGLISFASAITLGATALLDSSGGGASITLSNTVDGSYDLTLTAGTGRIDMNSNLGATTPLASLTASGTVVHQHGSLQTTGAVQHTGIIDLHDNITTANSNVTLTGNLIVGETGPIAISTGAGTGNISVTGTIDGDISGRNLILTAGTGGVVLSSVVGGSVPFNDFTASGNTIALANFGSASPGATGTASLTAATTIAFNGTTYTNAIQSYTAGTFFNFNAGSSTTITSNNNDITFNTGTVQLAAGNHLTINSGGGDITLTPLIVADIGTTNLTVNAVTGDVTFVQIGTSGNKLNIVNLTSDNFSPTPVLDPAPGANVFANSLVTSSSSSTILAGDFNYPGPDYVFSNPVLIQNNGTVTIAWDTTGANGNLTFSQGLNSDVGYTPSVVINPGAANSVTFSSSIGGVIPLSSLAIGSATNVNINSTMDVGSFSQTGGSGTTTISAGITSTAAGGISIATSAISLAGSFVTGNGGDIVLNNSGALTSSSISINADGAFQQTGAGDVTICGNITTHDDEISFSGDVTLCDSLTLISKDATGGNVSFAGTIDGTISGAEDLIITAGTGDLTFSGVVGGGTRLGHFEFNSAHDVTVGAASVLCLEQFAGTGTTTLNGSVDINSIEGLYFIGSALTINNDVTTTNSGPISITNSGLLTLTGSADCTVNGAFTQNGAGLSSLAGAITADGVISFATAATLSAALALDTSSNDQNITFSSTINGPGSFTADVGSGALTISGSVGGSTRLGAFTISNAGDVSTLDITAASIEQTAGGGLTTLNGNLNTNNVAGINLTGTAFSITGDLITTNIGPVAIVNNGILSLTGGSNSSITGTFAQSGGGVVFLGGKVATVDKNLSFTNAVILNSDTILSSGSGGGTISFASTINGNNSLSLTAGIGDITFGSSLGSAIALGGLTVVSVRDLTYPAVRADSIAQSAASGTTIINGTMISLAVDGISISGGIITQNALVSTRNEGPIVIDNSGLFTVAANTDCSGSYTQSGAGDVHLSNSLVADEGMAFAGATTLTGNTALDTSVNNKNIVFSSTIDGGFDLTLTAGSGNITVSGEIGASSRLGAFRAVSADNISLQNIYTVSIAIDSCADTLTSNGIMNTNGAAGITLIGNNFLYYGNLTTTGGGSLTVTNSGTGAGIAGMIADIDGSFLQNGTGPIGLYATMITHTGGITFANPVTLYGPSTLNTSAGGGDINFFSTIDGTANLTFIAGAGNIILGGAVGGITPLGAITINSAADVTTQAITAASIEQVAGSISTIFNEDLDTSGVGGIDLNGSVFTFKGSATTAGGGPITITNSGLLILSTGKTISSDGAFLQDGAGTVSLGSNMTTTNDNIYFTTAVALNSQIALSTGAGAGTITFNSTVNGAYDLALTAGTGNIVANDAIGGAARLGNIIINSAEDVTVVNVTATSIRQLAGTGTSMLNGDLNTNGPIGINLIGTNFTRNGDITTTNGGSLTVTNSGLLTGSVGNVTSINGSYIQNGDGAVNLAGTITTSNGNISFSGPITLVDTTVLDSGTGAGDVSISNTVDGAKALTVTAGGGLVIFSETLGDNTALSSLTVSGYNLTVDNIGGAAAGVTGSTVLTAINNLNFTGTTYNVNQQTYDAESHFNMNAGALTTFTSSGDTITFIEANINLATSSDLTINSAGGNITIGNIYAQSGDLRSFTLNGGSGDLQVNIIGATGDSEFASVSLTGADITLTNDIFADALTLAPTGTLYAGGNIYMANSALHFPTAVVLTATKTFSSGSTTGGNITFDSTLDGDVDNTRGLTLIARTSDITFTGAVGSTHPLNTITVSSARNVLTNTAMTVNGFTQSSGIGTTTFGGALNVNTFLGLSLTGTNFVLSNPVTTSSNGAISINNSGILTLSGAVISAGAFTQSGAGSTTFSSSITAGQAVSFAGTVNLSSTPSIDTSAADRNITFSGAVEGGGALTLSAGEGNIVFSSDAGTSTRLGAVVVNSVHEISVNSVIAESINLVSSTEKATLNGTINTNGPGNALVLVGKNFVRNGALVTTNGGSVIVTNSGNVTGSVSNITSIAGSYTQNGTGPISLIGTINAGNAISFLSPLTLVGTSAFVAGGNILFSDTIDGNYNLSLSASGDITFTGALGSIIPISDLTISSATNVASGAITAGSITQSSGSGTSAFNGALSTSKASGINLTGTNITRGAAWTANNRGTIIINNSGAFTSTAAGSINSNGSFNQSGSGAVSLGGVVRSDIGSINFSGPVSLAAAANLNAGSTSAAVTFSSTLNGTHGLIINCSNNGNLLFSGNVGVVTPLDDISVAAAGNVTFPAFLNAASFDLVSATGVATLYSITGNGGNITLLDVNAGNILFGGIIDADSTNFVSQGAILNINVPVSINSIGTASFNALEGNVGSMDSPILVNTSGQIISGSTFLADFNGTAGDNTVHRIMSNSPCLVIFNGVIIYDCRNPPGPTPIHPSEENGIAAPGFDSSSFTLANDFFFKTFFLGDSYLEEREKKLIYYKTTINKVKVDQ